MDAEVVDVLRRARARIEDPAKWCQGALAEFLDEFGPDECKVCMDGALRWAATGDPVGSEWAPDGMSKRTDLVVARSLLVSGASSEWGIGLWNDALERTHAEVLAAFDRAIELAESSC